MTRKLQHDEDGGDDDDKDASSSKYDGEWTASQ